MRRALLLVGLWACGGASETRVVRDAGSEAVSEDRDADGLCDATEVAMGTDPDRADTDGDGLLDGHEVIAGTDARNREDPGADHIVYLRRGSRVDFILAVIVDDPGPGVFGDRNAFDPGELRAGAFYRGSTNLASEPAGSGRTRLRFSLRFADLDEADAGAADGSNAAQGCAAVLPFDYGATADNGTKLTQERFVLIVADTPPPLAAAEFCLPVACL